MSDNWLEFAYLNSYEKIDKSGRPRKIQLHGETVTQHTSESDTVVRLIQPDTIGCMQLIQDKLKTTENKTSSINLTQVTYFGEYESVIYQLHHDPPRYGFIKAPQVSIMQIGDKGLKIESDGHLADPLSIICEQYWSWELVADLLPYEYEPLASKKYAEH